jgi:hypothetical protein
MMAVGRSRTSEPSSSSLPALRRPTLPPSFRQTAPSDQQLELPKPTGGLEPPTPSLRVNPSRLTRAYECARQRTNRLQRAGNRSDAPRRAYAVVAKLNDPGRTRPAGHDTRRAADVELTVASDVRFGVYLCPARDAATGALAAQQTRPREGRTASKACCSPRAPPLRGQSQRAISIRRHARVSSQGHVLDASADVRFRPRLLHKGVRKALEPNWWETSRFIALTRFASHLWDIFSRLSIGRAITDRRTGSVGGLCDSLVQEQFSSCPGLGASESTQAGDAGGQPRAAGKEGRAGSGPERLSVQIARLGFSVQECFPRGSGRWGRKGLLFHAQLTRIVVSPACDGEPPEPVNASAARSVAAAARKRVPPAPARDACGPAIVIEMPRRGRVATSRGPLAGAPVPQARRGR